LCGEQKEAIEKGEVPSKENAKLLKYEQGLAVR
jgi:hypothetical protein